MLIYQKASLFTAPLGSILVHACNAQGVWGSGIAVEFKKRFPGSFTAYNQYCTDALTAGRTITGTALVTGPEQGYYIGCLITSFNYGVRRDAEPVILTNTEVAVRNLLRSLKNPPAGVVNPIISIYSNKFNSGFFGVRWEETEEILKDLTGPTVWTVMDPNL